MGIRGTETSDLIFENVKVPKENLLGKEGQGFERINIACPKHILEKALNRLLEAVNRVYKK